MGKQLEEYYEQELRYIRELGVEFGRDRPKIADRLALALEEGVSQDPHVERLIQGFAFLTARIRLKLEDEFPELTDALLSLLYPHYLAPVPSMGIAQFVADPYQGQLGSGPTVPRHSQLYSRAVGTVPCRFQTAYPVVLWPVEIVTAHYQIAPFGEFNLPTVEGRVKSLLRLELRTTGGTECAKVEMDTLRFFLCGHLPTVHQVYELLLNQACKVIVRGTGDRSPDAAAIMEQDCLQPVGFAEDEGLLPYGNRSFLGYRLLTEYFAFPYKFFFIDLSGLKNVFARSSGNGIEIFVLFDSEDASLETRIDKDNFRLGCTPIVNLFRHSCDPIRLTHLKTEYHVLPDVRYPSAFEVYSIDELSSTDSSTGSSVDIQPMYASRQTLGSTGPETYWYATRRPSVRKDDTGTEVYVSLVDLAFNPRMPASQVLHPAAMCTNRDLPGELSAAGGESWGFQLEGQAPLRRILPVILPTGSKRLPLDEGRWRLISHLAVNHLSITEGEEGAHALRDILRLYDYLSTRATVQHIEGIASVQSRRKTVRLADRRGTSLCRGVEVEIELYKDHFPGGGAFLFASVLDRFLAMYASINSFTKLISRFRGAEEPFKKWPCRAGDQTVI